MDKASVVFFREKYKDLPVIYICDNEHNFMDNCSDVIPPVWDDANERVMFIQTNQDNMLDKQNLPVTISITNYEHIQLIKAYATKEDAVKFLLENKTSFKNEEKYKYGLKMLGGHARSHRPAPNSQNYWDE